MNGGLDQAVQSAIGGTIAWHSDIEPGPSWILAHHWPDVPNLGDITQIDWTDTERVDVITGGFPCQDVSHAGRRQGLIRDGAGKTRSGLWGEMLRAINHHHPSLVVAENVRGLLSAQADSDLEPCPFCMGDNGDSPMRALGAVLADLADIGYDAAWCGLRAADVGAPHGRFRVFILAWPATDTEHDGRHGATLRRSISEGQAVGRVQQPQRSPSDPGLELFATPQSRDWKGVPGAGFNTANLARDVSLLPTPEASRAGGTAEQHPDKRKAGGHGPTLADEIEHLLPTPRVTQAGYADDGRGGKSLDVEARCGNNWGDYSPAIARWENVLGRPAPEPTQPSARTGRPQLSPRFVEWMMGLPDGHVTDVPDLSRNAQLKALGNGVVPQQAEAALRWLLHVRQTALTQEAA